MKYILLFYLMSRMTICSYGQDNNPGCLENTLSFIKIPDGYYITDYCKYSEFFSYEFEVDRGSRAIKKEGEYREVWYKKKDNSNRHVSGLQILNNYTNTFKAAGGEVIQGSDGHIFKILYDVKEIWIYVNANVNDPDLDNFGIFSIAAERKQGINLEVPDRTTVTNNNSGRTIPSGNQYSIANTTGIIDTSNIVYASAAGHPDMIEFKFPENISGKDLATKWHLVNTASGNSNQQATPTAGYPVHTIGEEYGGGIVFYVYDNGQHGLIAAKQDQSTGIIWSPVSRINGVDYIIPTLAGSFFGIGGGKLNTQLITAKVANIDAYEIEKKAFAARICLENFEVDDNNVFYGDWYLPCFMELKLLYQQKDIVGGFGNQYYWSSTENDYDGAMNFINAAAISFYLGYEVWALKTDLLRVRAIRSF